MYLQTSQNNVYAEAWQDITTLYETDPVVLSADHQEHIDKVLEGNYAYIGDKTGFETAMSQHCNLEVVKDEFLPSQYAIGLQNNSAFVDIVSQG